MKACGYYRRLFYLYQLLLATFSLSIVLDWILASSSTEAYVCNSNTNGNWETLYWNHRVGTL